MYENVRSDEIQRMRGVMTDEIQKPELQRLLSCFSFKENIGGKMHALKGQVMPSLDLLNVFKVCMAACKEIQCCMNYEKDKHVEKENDTQGRVTCVQ